MKFYTRLSAIGKSDDFLTAIFELCYLEEQMIFTYYAVDKFFKSKKLKKKLSAFREAHEFRMSVLQAFLDKRGIKTKPVKKPQLLLLCVKLYFASLSGNFKLIKRLNHLESYAVSAYERLCEHPDKWLELEAILLNGLECERKHQYWLEKKLYPDKFRSIKY